MLEFSPLKAINNRLFVHPRDIYTWKIKCIAYFILDANKMWKKKRGYHIGLGDGNMNKNAVLLQVLLN